MDVFSFHETTVPFWTAIAALAAIGTACVTSIYTYLTLKLFRTQAEPKVIIYVRQSINSPFMLELVIENIGRDIAFDVKFEISRPIPEYASGLNPNTDQVFKVMSDGPVIHGIPALEPCGIRVICWGQYGGLTKALGGAPVTVGISFRHRRRLIRGYGILDVTSFASGTANDPPVKKIARYLEDINKNIRRIENKLDPLVVKMYQENVEEDENTE